MMWYLFKYRDKFTFTLFLFHIFKLKKICLLFLSTHTSARLI